MFSRAVGRVGHCRQISLVCVGSTHSVWPHWVCPHSRCVYFPSLRCSGSRLLYRERALSCVRFQFSGTPQRRRLGCACVLCLPRPSSSGSQVLDERTLPRCGAPYPLCGPKLSFRLLVGCAPMSVLRSWSLAATLPADVNHPESQEVFG